LLDGRADVVYGSRFHNHRAHRILYFWHTVGNRVLTLASNMTTDLNLTDMETCYKMGRTSVMQSLRLEEDRFGVEPEMTAKLAQLGVSIYEVGISYDGRTYEEGKKIGWRDGVRAIWCIGKYARSSRPKFPAAEAVPAVADLDETVAIDATSELLAEALRPHLGSSILEIGTRPHDAEPFDALAGSNPVDTIVVHGLEQIENDRDFVRAAHARLAPGGKLLLLVPAGRSLYSDVDMAMGRYRRYTTSMLRRLMSRADFTIDELRFFNASGALPWWLFAKKLGRRPSDAQAASTWNRLVGPAFDRVESQVRLPFGEHLLCVAYKQ